MIPFQVAIAQHAPVLGDFERNLQAHLELGEKAREQGARLIVFPELSLTGYFVKDLVGELAMVAEDQKLAPLRELSHQIDVVAGFIEQGDAHRVYLSSGYFAGGILRHVHRKVYLPTYGMFEEARFLTPGQRLQAFDTDMGRAAILICEDLWHPSTVGVMAADGAELLIAVAASPARGFGGDRPDSARIYEQMNRVYAQLFGMHVVFANRIGFEDGVGFWGGSEIVDPFGREIAKAAYFEPGLLHAAVDPRETHRAQILTPLGRDERLDLTLGELSRIARASAVS